MKRIQSALLGASLALVVLVAAACGNNSGPSGSSGHPTNIPGMGGPTFDTFGTPSASGADSVGAPSPGGSSGAGSSITP
jgi:hypothetical protein